MTTEDIAQFKPTKTPRKQARTNNACTIKLFFMQIRLCVHRHTSFLPPLLLHRLCFTCTNTRTAPQSASSRVSCRTLNKTFELLPSRKRTSVNTLQEYHVHDTKDIHTHANKKSPTTRCTVYECLERSQGRNERKAIKRTRKSRKSPFLPLQHH